MTMQNGKEFSTGKHPVEALLPMSHLKDAGFEFEVVGIYDDLKSSFGGHGAMLGIPEGPKVGAILRWAAASTDDS